MKEKKEFKPIERIKIIIKFLTKPEKNVLLNEISEKAKINFSNPNLAFRTFVRYSNNVPLVADYPNSTLQKATHFVNTFGVEYNPMGESIAYTKKEPLLSYAYPHNNLGSFSIQKGYIIVFDITKAPTLFVSDYATPPITQHTVQQLKRAAIKIIEITYTQ